MNYAEQHHTKGSPFPVDETPLVKAAIGLGIAMFLVVISLILLEAFCTTAGPTLIGRGLGQAVAAYARARVG